MMNSRSISPKQQIAGRARIQSASEPPAMQRVKVIVLAPQYSTHPQFAEWSTPSPDGVIQAPRFAMTELPYDLWRKHYAKDKEGNYKGTEEPAEDCLLKPADDLKWPSRAPITFHNDTATVEEAQMLSAEKSTAHVNDEADHHLSQVRHEQNEKTTRHMNSLPQQAYMSQPEPNESWSSALPQADSPIGKRASWKILKYKFGWRSLRA